MNFLFISSEYPPETGFGGIGTYTRNIAQGLAGRGHRVDVIALSKSGEAHEQTDGPVSIHRIGPGRFPLPGGRLFYPFRKLCYKTIFHSLVRMAWARSVQEKYEELRTRTRYDIIEAPECGAEAGCLRPAGGAKLVIRLHTPWALAAALDQIQEPFLDTRTTGRMERRTAQRAHAVSAPTRAISRIYKKRWGLKAVECYPNPMDTQIYMPKSGQGDYIIYTGRVEYRKGVHVLIKAYALLVKKGIDVPLVLAGAPYGNVKKGGLSYEKIITALIEENGLKEKVTWIKGPDRREIQDLLGRARIAVYPSVWENFPYTCLEAMAAGVPVAASRCGGYSEMIEDGKSGRLFTPLNAGELCDVLAGLLADGDLSARLGRGGRQRVIEAYSVDKVSAEAETFYERTAHG